jgi:hypothetical protein
MRLKLKFDRELREIGDLKILSKINFLIKILREFFQNLIGNHIFVNGKFFERSINQRITFKRFTSEAFIKGRRPKYLKVSLKFNFIIRPSVSLRGVVVDLSGLLET